MIEEFIKFLKEYKIVTLAVAFVMSTASTNLVNSIVKDVVMPVVSPLLSTGKWQDAVIDVAWARIAIGSFLAELLNFIVLALVVFIVAKKLVSIARKKTY